MVATAPNETDKAIKQLKANGILYERFAVERMEEEEKTGATAT